MGKRACSASLLGAYFLLCGAPLLASGDAQAAPAAELEAALRSLGGGGADLVLFPEQASGGAVVAATRVRAAPAAVEAVLRSPAAYREAVPSLARADVVARRPAAGDGRDQDLLVAWELEIPLFNLKGKMWISARPTGVEVTLIEGNLAPGRLLFTWRAVDHQTTALFVEARFNVRAGGWVLRRVASSNGFAEPAITAAATWVALRATAARAEHPTSASSRRPHAPPTPPATLDGSALATAPLAALRARGGVTALVQRAPSGRLAAAAVAVSVNRPAAEVATRVATPEQWRAFPGWRQIKRVARGASAGVDTLEVDVEDSLPFVDLDARWRLRTRPALRAQAVDGDTRGAMFGWDISSRPPSAPTDLATAAARGGSLAVLVYNPLIQASGYVPRRFVEAEPLLEHGLALALTYVNAVAMRGALEASVPVVKPAANQ